MNFPIYATYEEGGEWTLVPAEEYPLIQEALQTGTDRYFKAILMCGFIIDLILRTNYPERTEIHVCQLSKEKLEFLDNHFKNKKESL